MVPHVPHTGEGTAFPIWSESVRGDPSPGDPVRRFAVCDNIEALKHWNRMHAGQAALVLADPPYNARNIKDYDDDLAHDTWIAQLRTRLELCIPLLRHDGILAVHIDDSEHAYLQILLDDLLGRGARMNTVVVKMSELAGVKMRYQTRMLPRIKEYVLFYGKGAASHLRPLSRRKEGPVLDRYLRYYTRYLANPSDPVEGWRTIPLTDAMIAQSLHCSEDSIRNFQIEHADRVVYRTNNRWFDSLSDCDRPTTRFARLCSPWGVEYIWWEGRQMLFLKDHLDEPLGDIWTDLSTINVQKEGGEPLRSSKKPEALIERILTLCTAPGDLVVDPWTGSGTTAAVAHKTGRGWLACERDIAIAERALKRLGRVCEGVDPTGVTSLANWAGGGGFRLEVPPPIP